LVFLSVLSGGCASTPTNGPSGSTAAPAAFDGPVATLWVKGMGCPQCANNVDLQLLKVKGVEKIFVDLGNGRVLAKLSPAFTPSRDQLARAIHDSGFTLDRIEMPPATEVR
jgi:copper chaperone CopZ